MKCLTVLLVCITMLLFGCGEETHHESPPSPIMDAPAAPAALTTDWIAHNVRVKSFTTTRTQILIWITYERDGTQTVSRLVEIDK